MLWRPAESGYARAKRPHAREHMLWPARCEHRRRSGRRAALGVAEAPRALGDRVEDRLEIGRRARDDAQDSLVAVCCSSASVSSRLRASSSVNRRTFSIAMTAWSAKVSRSAMCSSENRPSRGRVTVIAPMGTPSFSMGTKRAPRGKWRASSGSYSGSDDRGDIHHRPIEDRAAGEDSGQDHDDDPSPGRLPAIVRPRCGSRPARACGRAAPIRFPSPPRIGGRRVERSRRRRAARRWTTWRSRAGSHWSPSQLLRLRLELQRFG